MSRNDDNVAIVGLGDDTSHDGKGWYFWDEEYPEAGSCGAYPTREAAETEALKTYDRVELEHGSGEEKEA